MQAECHRFDPCHLHQFYDALVQLVRILPCHGSGHRFEPGTHRQVFLDIAQPGSAPALGAGGREFDPLYPDQNPPG